MLTGYRVLDITQFVAGPTCTRLLAEMGAEVIKIELAPAGDRGRGSGDKPIDPRFKGSSQSSYYFQHNHSKKSLALDFKNPKALDLIRALAAESDVLVENFAPGVMARSGLDYERLCAINPRLIMCSISLAGQSGPLADKPGYDFMGAAYAGVTAQIGEAERPAQFTIAIGDSATGVTAAMAIGFALLHRERTGEGQYIEASLLDTYFHMHEANVAKTALRGPGYAPGRMGPLHTTGGPTGIFHCGGGEHVSIMVMPHQWAQMVTAMGMPELLQDARFKTPQLRRDNNAALAAIIEGWLGGFPSRAEALAALERERVPCAPVLSLHEAMQHPHLRQRRTVRAVHDPELGTFDIPGLPVKFSAWAEPTELRADRLGEHNESVLQDLLGLSEAEIAVLYREKVLVRDTGLESSSR